MRMMQGIRLDGQSVYLVEVVEAYFPHIIAWRNDPENNRYLNQPFLLTLEKQRTWYAQYCSDPAQGLLIVVDKETDAPFATMGWTDYDPEQRLCITGRLRVGDRALKVDTCYAHIVRDNIASIRYHEKYGFHRNDGIVRFPNELIVNGMKQGEYARSQADWLSVRARIAQSVAGRGTNEPSRRGAI